jgi:transcriptional regulator with XRE-family HTH domain
MPRRRRPDPLAKLVGQRIRALREDQGLTLEKLAYESELGSKRHLSDIERGLTRPTIATLKALADHLGVDLLDVVTFPDASPRQRLVDMTRGMSGDGLQQLLTAARGVAAKVSPRGRG